MLTGYQVEVVGFFTDHGPICWDCARAEHGSLTVERARMGLSTGMGFFDPIIRYTADEYASENGFHCGCADDLDHDPPKAGEEPEGYDGVVDHGWENENGEWRSHYYHEACARLDCYECGEDISS